MILLIDNYDSFSYNLYQLIGAINPDIRVMRNDAVTVEEIRRLAPERIVISPGPGRPEQAGIIVELVKELSGTVPILGVCLGHQAICAAFGAKIVHAPQLMHGKQSVTHFDNACPLFRGCPTDAPVARYHSLIVDEATLPPVLKVTARAETGDVMAVAHVNFPVYGVQFHPESIMTPDGRKMTENFLSLQEA